MPDVLLGGCASEPLLNYLKALGVLRLVAEQADAEARASWHKDRLVLRSRLDGDALLEFFLADYRPTPIVGPWAGGSGFFDKDRKTAVLAISASTNQRLEPYREVIGRVQAVLASRGITEKPRDDVKRDLLRCYRAVLPDEAILWLDAAIVLGEARDASAPILGSGGNDGRLDFGRNFMERLVDLGFDDDSTASSGGLLQAALFGEVVSGLGSDAVGQFHPGGSGGPNATIGMEADSQVNGWDWVLALEGALLLGGAASRRYGTSGQRRAAFPFTVESVAVGDNAPSESETASSRRGELWLPLWDRWTALPELRALFAEGRLTLGREQARDGVESARAVTTLGVQRGLSQFVRYGFLERNGRSYLATPMGRFAVRREQSMELLDWGDAGQWLHRFRDAAKSSTAPPRFSVALRRLDEAVLAAARFGGPQRVAGVLASLGAIERELSITGRPGHVGTLDLAPLPLLHRDWWRLADDGSCEFRLARALVSLGQIDGGEPLRANLEPLRGDTSRVWWDTQEARCVVRAPGVVRLLAGVLERRLLDLGIDGLRAASSVSLGDAAHFLAGTLDERRLLDLIWGLALVAQPGGGRAQDTRPAPRIDASVQDDVIVPRAWALAKLVFIAPRHHTDGESAADADTQAAPRRLILGRLRAGDLDGAAREASRRLRVAGLVPLPGPRSGGGERPTHFLPGADPGHLQAALLLPISRRAEAQLLRLVVRESSSALSAAGAHDEPKDHPKGGAR